MPGPMRSGGLVVDVESDSKAVATRAGARRPVDRYIGDLVEGARSLQKHDAEYTSHLINTRPSSTLHADLIKYTRPPSATTLRYKIHFWTTPPSASPLDGQFKIPIHQGINHHDASIKQPRDSNIESLWHEIERIKNVLPSRDEFDLYVSEAGSGWAARRRGE